MLIKDAIKQTAISLFNTHSIANVSMKQIADALHISAGNLSYHYKTKAILLNVIYDEMYAETQDYILPKNTYITLFHFEEMMLKFDDLQQRYSFFFNDVVHIIKTYSKIAKQYRISNMVRFKDAKKLIAYYVETERLKPESNNIDYDKIIHMIWMTSTFWQAQKLALQSQDYTINQDQSIGMLWQILLPHLTTKGLEEYHQFKQFTNPINTP